MRNMGLGRRYVDGKLGMTFVLETHVTYDREMRGGAPMRFTSQLLERDAKKVHLFHEMFHAEQGYLAATNETIVMNIDYATRRSAPWPAPVAERLEALWQAHRGLKRPAKAGRGKGLGQRYRRPQPKQRTSSPPATRMRSFASLRITKPQASPPPPL